MDIKINWVSSKYIELSVGNEKSGVLNAKEAKELALEFNNAVSALLSVSEKQ